jgi:tetratricopeptide (TPR) repeat protein
VNPPSLDALYDLAREHAEAGRKEEAKETYLETLRRVRAELTSDQADWVIWVEKLGSAFSSLNEFEQSIDLMERAFKRRETTQGRSHPETQSVLFQLGIVFEKSGQYDKAIPMLEEVYEASKKDSKIFFNPQFLATSYAKVGRTADSMRIIEGDLEKFRGYYPAGSPEIASRLAFYGNMLSESGAFKESVSLLRECLQIRETTQPNAWTTYSVRSLLGGALLGTARAEANAEEKAKIVAEAESLLVSGYEGLKARESEIPVQVASRVSEALDRLIGLLTYQGKLQEAEQYRNK